MKVVWEMLNNLKGFKNPEKLNIAAFDKVSIVKEYSNFRNLQKPEKAILDLLKPKLKI